MLGESQRLLGFCTVLTEKASHRPWFAAGVGKVRSRTRQVVQVSSTSADWVRAGLGQSSRPSPGSRWSFSGEMAVSASSKAQVPQAARRDGTKGAQQKDPPWSF